MPTKVLLRGFDPEIPEGQIVTFCDDLPPNVVCAQCDNVSAILHKDPAGHAYCTSCTNMCSNGGCFECPECNRKVHFSQLIVDRSTRDRIRTMKVICPNAVPGNPVQITFNAIKAHLTRCSCGQVADAPADSEQPASLSSLSMSSKTLFKCPKCKEGFGKKLVGMHVRTCQGPRKLEKTQRQEVSSHQVSGPDEKSKGAGDKTFAQDSYSCKKPTLEGEDKPPAKFADSFSEHPPSVIDSPFERATDPRLLQLTQQLEEAQKEISYLKDENGKLKEELCKKNASLQEALSTIKQEEERKHEAQQAIGDLGKSVASLCSLQKDCDRLRDCVDQLSSNIMQVTQHFQQGLQKIAHMFPPARGQCRPNLEEP
ncbi:uncharacterized protein LOC144104300 [Amblyomma americanum]